MATSSHAALPSLSRYTKGGASFSTSRSQYFDDIVDTPRGVASKDRGCFLNCLRGHCLKPATRAKLKLVLNATNIFVGLLALFFSLSMCWYAVVPTFPELDDTDDDNVELGEDREAAVRNLFATMRNWSLGGIVPSIVAGALGIKAMVGEHRKWLFAYIVLSVLSLAVLLISIFLLSEGTALVSSVCGEVSGTCFKCSGVDSLKLVDECADEAFEDGQKRCMYQEENLEAVCESALVSVVVTLLLMCILSLISLIGTVVATVVLFRRVRQKDRAQQQASSFLR